MQTVVLVLSGGIVFTPTDPRPVFDQMVQAILNRDRTNGCWIWRWGTTQDGYGQFWYPPVKLMMQAHVTSWHLANGKFPEPESDDPADKIEVDHLCYTRACWNPQHLEAVSHKENIRRRDAHAATGSKKTKVKSKPRT